MRKPDIEQLDRILKKESESFGGKLPELHHIAWRAYFSALVGETLDGEDLLSNRDFDEKLRQYFPELEDDPVSAILCGEHYKGNYYGVADGEFVDESEFEGLYRKIKQETKHFGGQLPPPYTVAWTGQLLGLHQCNLITDSEYEQLLGMLPVVEDNPVKRVEAFTRQYASS
ncbi:MAG: hypothetical protein K2X81_27050 [Candidatus Obscuribacterales bacterium]|nr:hypothetical protein [Candidatus Obscuribacterales bacterium]